MATFSVKKPFTVFVAVIAILVLGVVAFTNMTPDLLPNINMPYVMIITAYPGATPERVETVVSKPMEQVMATLENIENISSTSSENSSMVLLEFTEEVNMESITVDILQNLSQLEEYWDESVGTPYLLKLNPAMLPVMVAAVNVEGMDTIELSAFVNDTLLNKLEGTAGVASVAAQGVIEESIDITLDPDKIAAKNREISGKINAEFADAEQELEDSQDEIEGQLASIESGRAELQSQIDAAVGAASSASGQVVQGLQMQMQLYDQLAALTLQLQLLNEAEKLLVELEDSNAQLAAQQAEAAARLEQLGQLSVAIGELEAAQAAAQAIVDSELPEVTEEQKQAASAQLEEINAQLAAIDAQLAAMGITDRAQVAEYMQMATDAIAQAEAGFAALDATLAEMGVSRIDIPAAIEELRANKALLEDGIAQLQNAITQMESGSMSISDATAKLERQKLLGSMQLSQATSQMLVGEASLTMALNEIEKGLDQIEEAKQQALKAANLDSILTLETLQNILVAQNFTMPAGYVEQDGMKYLVRVGDSLTSVTELQNLMLVDLGLEGLSPIYLRDVASVELVNNADEVYAKLNGQDGVLLTFTKQSTYATAAVSDNIRARFEALGEEYEGLSYISLMDQGDYIYLVVNSILQNLLLGAVFAVIILFLFLRDIRPTFITLCSIPTSVIFAIALMYFSGVTINIISLSGLAVAVGMLVDNSVVVIENIYRLRKLGATRVQAAVSGATQVAGAIAASTLTTICVFLPIVFVQGLTRDLFTDMALTLAYSLMASLVVALTLVPAMSAGMLRKIPDKATPWYDGFIRFYERLLGWTMRHRVFALVAVTLLLVLSLVLSLLRGFEFMPSMDMPEMTVEVTLPEGSTQGETMAKADEVSARLQEIPEVETVGAMIGAGGFLGFGGGGDGNSIMYYVLLDEKGERSGLETAQYVNDTFTDMGCEVVAAGSSMADMSILGGSGVTINVYGDNMDDLMDTAGQVAAVVAAVEGTQNVEDGIGDTDPEIRFTINKNKAMEYNLTTAQIFLEISNALTSDATATSITSEGEDFDVIVHTGKADTLTPDYIKNYSFTVTDRGGEEQTVRLSDIAAISETETARAISRDNQRRYMTVSAEIADGYNVSLVTQQVQRAMQDFEAPTGITLEFSGENETIMDAFGELMKMLGLGVLLVYLIMVAQFQSLKSPFIVMFTIPLAFTGGLLALVLTGFELSVIALIGFVMLSGIIVNNGIVLVDYINQLRVEGVAKREAIAQAGVTRMRPVLMTSITTVLGLVMMALGIGDGAELMQPIAIVCIGGLVYATILTLFIIPVLYDLFNKEEMRVVDESEFELLDE